MMEYLLSFLIGGIICLIGQILIDKTKLTPARILVGYVVMGVILGALGLYEPIIKFAGAGATVPLSGFDNVQPTYQMIKGFGNLLAKGVRDAIDEKGFIGIFIGGLQTCSGGITAAIIAGLLAAVIFKAKDKS